MQRTGGNQMVVRMLAGRRLQRFKDPDTQEEIPPDAIPSLPAPRVAAYVRKLESGALKATEEEAAALRTAHRRAPGGLFFGSDIPAKDKHGFVKYSPEEKVQFFVNALRAGYRSFDAAEGYKNLEYLKQAAALETVDFATITLVYKLKTEPDPEPSTEPEQGESLASAATVKPTPTLPQRLAPVPLQGTTVVMLHEVPAKMTDAARWFTEVAQLHGKGRTVGVSNVDEYSLPELVELAKAAGLDLGYVQNEISPYHRDEQVREYCAAHGITYMGFGLLGGSDLGYCTKGSAMPSRHLRSIDDPRLKALAEKCSMSVSDLLLAWASRMGITIVLFSGAHAQQNLGALKRELSPEVLRAIDEILEVGQTKTRSANAQGPLAALYHVTSDPATWFVLDTLLSNPAAKELITKLVAIARRETKAEKEDAPNEQLDAVLRLMAGNIVRFATFLQTLQRIDEVHKDKPWHTELPALFERVSGGDLEKLYGWTQKEADLFTGARGSVEGLEKAGAKKAAATNSSASLKDLMVRVTEWLDGKTWRDRWPDDEDVAELKKRRLEIVKPGRKLRGYGKADVELWQVVSVKPDDTVEYLILDEPEEKSEK